MRRSATVLAATTRALIDRAAEEGLDPGELLRAANL
jgi:hypothetical protein